MYYILYCVYIPLLQDRRAPCFRFDGAIGLYIYYIRHTYRGIYTHKLGRTHTRPRLKFRRRRVTCIDRRVIVFCPVDILYITHL